MFWKTPESDRLEGLICPMLTPLTSAGKLDVEALERLIEHEIAGGIAGIFLLGTCGESPSLSAEFKHDLLARAADAIASRVPWFCGVGHTSIDESLKTAALAAEKGASAVVATTPYYYPLAQTHVRRWFEALADRQMLPVLLYNYPKLTKTPIELETAIELLAHPNVIGIKDSSGEIEFVRALCERLQGRTDRAVFVGPERLLADALAAGANGGVCGGTNLFPSLYVSLFQAHKAGKSADVARLRDAIERVVATLYPAGSDTLHVVTNLKAAAAALGICEAFPAFPLTPHANAESEAFGDAVRTLRNDLSPSPAAT